jgi:nifR3 family TIM-barrel protein
MLIGLAPLDGITDAAYRFIVDKYGRPDLLYTEFIPTEGIILEKPGVLKNLVHHRTKTPLIVQLVGADPNSFYLATKIVIKQYPDIYGIDINMGCPERSVVKRGAGAGLIHDPERAIAIVAAVNLAVKDFSSQKILVSVKTRLGYVDIETEWIKKILSADLSVVCFHLRTLAQIYAGPARWEYMDKIVAWNKNKIKILGNGNVKSRDEAVTKISRHNIDGVLIGRAALGNPWIFTKKKPSKEERIKVMLEHCQKFMEFYPEGDFKSLRKHLAWYAKDFTGSAKIRQQLMMVNNLSDLNKIVSG